jgi:[ribosomal protein S18]-alanine N-acetyltransferase
VNELHEQYRIKDIQIDDISRLHEAEKICFPEEAWSEKDFLEIIEYPFSKGFIVEDKTSSLIGYMLVAESDNQAELLNIATLPKYRKLGLGRTLIGTWINDLSKRGFREVFLEVRASNHSAIKLYESIGFKTIDKRKNYYSDGEDALTMFLALHLAI